jgi:hypothetical protein
MKFIIKGAEKKNGVPYLYLVNEQNNIEIYVIEWSEIIEKTKRKLKYLSAELKVKDISVKEKIARDFSEINIDELKSRLKKSSYTEVDDI